MDEQKLPHLFEPSAAACLEMRKLTAQNEGSILKHLESYVLFREKTCEAFERLDPNSSFTQDALALLEKARNDLTQFKLRFDDGENSQPDKRRQHGA